MAAMPEHPDSTLIKIIGCRVSRARKKIRRREDGRGHQKTFV
jgi:hypothetical protein